jgi:pimeloyl-ACP methyl ester carboxylesterase
MFIVLGDIEMKKCVLIIALALLTAPAFALEIKPHEFEARDGTKVAAEWGEINVPARHEEPDGVQLKLAFVRFKSTNPNPGHPIVYLAGGPGGSGIGTAKGARFPLFMALREIADVIALDQRGTGRSTGPPACEYPEMLSPSVALVRENFMPHVLAAARYCDEKWGQEGVDVGAYTTWQSAADLEVLRRELQAEKLNLWGISYGTHLALAAMKRNPQTIDKVVLASVEGLEQTVKLPARSDRFFERVAQLIAADPKASQAYPDLLGVMREVLERLEKKPVTVSITPRGHDKPIDVTIGKFPVQLLTSFGLVKNPENIAALPITYYGMLAGHYEQVAMRLYQLAYARPQVFQVMSTAMDGASGISKERKDLAKQQAQTALLGDTLNYPYPQLFGAFKQVPDLGDDFRREVESDIPALVLTGTLDGRTFPEAHADVLAGLSRGQQVIVENAGHDLFMSSPMVTTVISEFLRGKELSSTLIKLPPPEFIIR